MLAPATLALQHVTFNFLLSQSDGVREICEAIEDDASTIKNFESMVEDVIIKRNEVVTNIYIEEVKQQVVSYVLVFRELRKVFNRIK
ncbi:hypothetical protein PR048_002042 [Dryococelus australis]|uniref:Uncharacterized protein n=1 Tax=Dryococelus australis TaxID=614101 RepID=A0ABQ9IJ64_9NEOP|nr:hypothetical protein PR048_002042 [Dryococelus australis]